MKTLSKVLVGTIAAGAMAISSASPAAAQNRGSNDRGGNRDGISAGDVIAGAIVLGGIAAVASSAGRSRDYGYDNTRYGGSYDRGYDNSRRYDDHRGYNGGNPRQAVEQCVRAAESEASRYSYGRADVTDIREVRDTRNGFEVRGRIAVNSNGRNWRQGDNRYGSGWGGDYRGYNDSHRGYDSGSFKCKFERGRIADLDFSGVRGL